ncbi:MAG: DEAD/DEAH box helicase [Alteromonadaceae bacterium]|nr:MAG: DEAD/DEAH box helicase [Alteromonadaceae bacterium]
MTFSKLGLSDPIVQAVREAGYTRPTAVQEKVIPVVNAGRDLVATSQTGTGKTAGFVLPILEGLRSEYTRRAKRIRALILVPSRELALQVEANIQKYSKYLDFTSMAMVGGLDVEPQKQALIDGVDIVVATPGRLLDMAHQRALHFDALEYLVLDEADRMLDMGFVADINKIIERLPAKRQNLLFSATMSDAVRLLADTAIDNAFEVSIDVDKATVYKISQWVVSVDKHNKSALLSQLIIEREWSQALIFIRTKHGAAKLVSQLEKRGIKAEAIHGDRSQSVRTQILADFKSGDIGFLVATGVAARGLDIDGLTRVVNYDLPDDANDYIHRIGRTGRAGASGEAVSLVSFDDFKRMCAIERRLDQVLERKVIEGFVTAKELPASNLSFNLTRGEPDKEARKKDKAAKKSNFVKKKHAAKKAKSLKAEKTTKTSTSASQSKPSKGASGERSKLDFLNSNKKGS